MCKQIVQKQSVTRGRFQSSAFSGADSLLFTDLLYNLKREACPRAKEGLNTRLKATLRFYMKYIMNNKFINCKIHPQDAQIILRMLLSLLQYLGIQLLK